jgi:anti-sigma regulatory factor (Ser/Thr protein kinase)/putative methionine-R-sulfoxide reductase with GAF domain
VLDDIRSAPAEVASSRGGLLAVEGTSGAPGVLASAEENRRRVESLADASWGRLDLDELLTVLLGHVLDLTGCDTAAVLLHDRAAHQLVARAARGLEEEVRQGVRIPIGVGFAGRVAAERRSIVLDRVDASTVANPILAERGIQSMLGVPLLAAGELIGVIHVGSLTDRTFDDDTISLLELAADKIAEAVRSSIVAAEHRAAVVLQRSLLPSKLLDHPQIEFASRYVPAQLGEVGGDWYDAFEVPTGDVWVMTGDVTGHGLNPAIVMGRLKSTLRAYALLGMSPEDVLRAANRKLQHFESGAMATVICGVTSPPFHEFRVCSAGHLPPVLLNPGTAPKLLDVPPAPPLGVVPELEARSTRWPMHDGSTLVFYTDGLVERRGESINEGLNRLCFAVSEDGPERLCARLMDSMIGRYVPDDDVALLVLRLRPLGQPSEAEGATSETKVARSRLFAPVVQSVREARRFVSECVEQLGLERMPDVQLIVSELANNAILHSGSSFDVTVERLDDDAVRVEVRDFGPGTPRLINRGTAADSGRGLQIVDLLADTWGVATRPGGIGKSAWFIVAGDPERLTRRQPRMSGSTDPP